MHHMPTISNNRASFEKKDSQRGQIGIVILLLTVVLLTIGLSITSRTITDVRLSRQEEETSRAFDAAEAGIEDALRRDLSGLAGGTYDADIGACPGSDCIEVDYQVQQEQSLATELNEGETVEVNLDGFAGSRVDIDWGYSGEQCSLLSADPFASIVVAVFDSSGNVRRQPYSANGCNRGDSFSQSAGPGPAPYLLTVSQPVNADDVYMRVRVVYSDTQIRIESANPGPFPLPPQFYRVHSEARTTGEETRAVEVTQTNPAPPSIFDFVIFSNNNLVKN